MLVVKTLWLDAAAAAVLNLPFGYWRMRVAKFSRKWFVAVHAPVPLVIALRILSRLKWSPVTLAVLLCASVLGQVAGGRLRSQTRRSSIDGRVRSDRSR